MVVVVVVVVLLRRRRRRRWWWRRWRRLWWRLGVAPLLGQEVGLERFDLELVVHAHDGGLAGGDGRHDGGVVLDAELDDVGRLLKHDRHEQPVAMREEGEQQEEEREEGREEEETAAAAGGGFGAKPGRASKGCGCVRHAVLCYGPHENRRKSVLAGLPRV